MNKTHKHFLCISKQKKTLTLLNCGFDLQLGYSQLYRHMHRQTNAYVYLHTLLLQISTESTFFRNIQTLNEAI